MAGKAVRNPFSIYWDNSAAEMRSSDKVRDELIARAQGDRNYQARGVQADAATLVDGAAKIIDKTFCCSLLPRAPMLPLT